MPSVHERARNNVRAGIFVTVTLLLALGVLVVLTDAIDKLTRRMTEYTVTFDVDGGVGSLSPGSDVRVGGVPMGRVTSVVPIVRDGDVRTIDVGFKIASDVVLKSDAIILVDAAMIGAESWLAITSVGTGAPPENNRIQGTTVDGFLAKFLGASNAANIGNTISNVTDFSQVLVDEGTPILQNVNKTTADARALVEDVRSRWPSWADRVNDVMTWTSEFTPKLDAALAEGHDLLRTGREVIDENRPNVKAAVQNMADATANVKQTTETVNQVTIQKVHDFLDTGNEAIASARDAITALRTDYELWATNLGEALAKANLAAQQLKLATVEIRRSPWKLLYRPSDEELEHELLYEAARSFALAASDLKASSEAVRRIVSQHGDRLAVDEEAYRRIERNLQESLSKYEKAQQQLLDVLITQSPASDDK